MPNDAKPRTVPGFTDAASIFYAGGPLKTLKPEYRPRPQQVAMAVAVEKGLQAAGTTLVEAGTGVGKSLAYLIPAAAWALGNDKRVIVSTHTKALQEQLLQQELPLVEKLFAAAGLNLRFCLLMGAENYLCIQRLHRAIEDKETLLQGPEDKKLLDELWEWAKDAQTGQRGRLPAKIGDGLWSQICRDPDICLGARGPFAEPCLWRKDFERARKAHILVVNHSLLLAGPHKWLPHDALIIDEAHNLEDAASQSLGATISAARIERVLDDIHNPKTSHGLLVRLRKLDPTTKGLLRGLIEKAHKANRDFFAKAQEKLALAAGFKVGGGSNARRIEEPNSVEDCVSRALYAIADELNSSVVSHCATKEEEEMVTAMAKRVAAVCDELARFVACSDAGQAYWAELRLSRRGPALELKMAPIHVGEALRERLFRVDACTILTSATLSASKRFDLFQERLGISECNTTLVESPFDYSNRVRVVVPPNLPDPQGKQEECLASIVETTERLAGIVPGGIFLLFTSWSMLHQTKAKLTGRLGARELIVQGDGPPDELLSRFRAAGRAVLLGTETFWQGVDVPGSALSCVVIARLPFTPPDSPLEEARQGWYKDRGKRPFDHYSLPKAVVKFRQGFGRLMRRHEDVGAVVVLDPRINTKKYGRTFLESIPRCPIISDFTELSAFFSNVRTASVKDDGHETRAMTSSDSVL